MNWEKVVAELDAASERAESERHRRVVLGTSHGHDGLVAANWVLGCLATALRAGLPTENERAGDGTGLR